MRHLEDKLQADRFTDAKLRLAGVSMCSENDCAATLVAMVNAPRSIVSRRISMFRRHPRAQGSLYALHASFRSALRGPSLRVLSIPGVQFIGSERIPVFRRSAAAGCCRR